MRNVPRVGIAILACLLTWAVASAAVEVQQQKAPSITVRIGRTAWTYTNDQLRVMATEKVSNLKGNRQKPAVPLETVLFKDTKLAPDKVHMIFVMGSKVTVLRGDDLKHLDKLVLATGPDKGDKPHHWTMMPRDEESYKALAPHMGSRRKGKIYRIDIVPKPEATQ
jgi:hypothetical protein